MQVNFGYLVISWSDVSILSVSMLIVLMISDPILIHQKYKFTCFYNLPPAINILKHKSLNLNQHHNPLN